MIFNLHFLRLFVLDKCSQILVKIVVSLFSWSWLLVFLFGWALLDVQKLKMRLYFVPIHLDERGHRKSWDFIAYYHPLFRINLLYSHLVIGIVILQVLG